MSENIDLSDIRITGVEINYFFLCQRKLWLFSHNIEMEHSDDTVRLGSLLHENSYQRKRKEIELDSIKLDFIEPSKGLVHEVKKSKAMEDAHIWQLKYYLYRLKQLGLLFSGKIDYPSIRRTENIVLTEEDEKAIEDVMLKIDSIKKLESPPKCLMSKICGKCSYYEFCFV